MYNTTPENRALKWLNPMPMEKEIFPCRSNTEPQPCLVQPVDTRSLCWAAARGKSHPELALPASQGRILGGLREGGRDIRYRNFL